MATNNVINLNGSGIVSYDGAGTFSALANPLTVSNGGLGISSDTAYSVLCAGTTSTSAAQSVSSVGVANQLLTSNGSSALPSFEFSSSGMYTLNISSGATASPPDALTFFIRAFVSLTTSTTSGNAGQRLYIPYTGTLVGCRGIVTCTPGSSENVTVSVRINNTTDYTATSTLQLSSSPATFTNNAMNVAVSQGDYAEIKVACPTWTSNPTSVTISITLNLM